MKSKIFIITITGLVAIILIASCIKKSQTDLPIEWTCVTDSASWSYRYNHSTVVFDNKMWIIGGASDVWFSPDGADWTCATESPGWTSRKEHTSVVFDNRIWVIGGWALLDSLHPIPGPINDVWFSSDGVNWVCATESAGWLARFGHTSVVFEDKIWVLGGEDRTGGRPFNDVWYSDNGRDWYCATDSAEWGPRLGHTSVVFDNKIWVIGGDGPLHHLLHDIWFSSNGVDWESVPYSTIWPRRCGHISVVFDDKVWIIAGLVGDNGGKHPRNDVWFSRDSKLKQWKCLTDSAPWAKREYLPSVVFDNKIWILGGYPTGNDVWYGEIVRGKR